MLENKPGIYKITNIINGKIYIGSAIDIKNRWVRHVNFLKDKKHHNKYLQNSFNKHGEDSFICEVLMYLDSKEDLVEFEQNFLDKLLPYKDKGYNISKIAGKGNQLGIKRSEETKTKMKESWTKRKNSGYKVSKETREKISNSLKGKSTWNKGKSTISYTKHVYQYSFEGELIKKWNSIKSIQQELGWTQASIRKNCNLVKNNKGELIAFKNYIWSWEKIKSVKDYISVNNIKKKYKYLGIKGKS